jgi:hypothetical protein
MDRSYDSAVLKFAAWCFEYALAERGHFDGGNV